MCPPSGVAFGLLLTTTSQGFSCGAFGFGLGAAHAVADGPSVIIESNPTLTNSFFTKVSSIDSHLVERSLLPRVATRNRKQQCRRQGIGLRATPRRGKRLNDLAGATHHGYFRPTRRTRMRLSPGEQSSKKAATRPHPRVAAFSLHRERPRLWGTGVVSCETKLMISASQILEVRRYSKGMRTEQICSAGPGDLRGCIEIPHHHRQKRRTALPEPGECA
jgi:hypothetical protein